MVGLPSAVNAAQEIAEEISPAPVTFERISSPKDLKNRLNWGKPDLTIIDVRDRSDFNSERIMGAVPVPAEQVVRQMQQLAEFNRDIYVYGNSESDAINAAAQLDRAGFRRVAVLEGGLPMWKAIGGRIEGSHT